MRERERERERKKEREKERDRDTHTHMNTYAQRLCRALLCVTFEWGARQIVVSLCNQVHILSALHRTY